MTHGACDTVQVTGEILASLDASLRRCASIDRPMLQAERDRVASDCVKHLRTWHSFDREDAVAIVRSL